MLVRIGTSFIVVRLDSMADAPDWECSICVLMRRCAFFVTQACTAGVSFLAGPANETHLPKKNCGLWSCISLFQVP